MLNWVGIVQTVSVQQAGSIFELFILEIVHENTAFTKASTVFVLLALIFDFCTLRLEWEINRMSD